MGGWRTDVCFPNDPIPRVVPAYGVLLCFDPARAETQHPPPTHHAIHEIRVHTIHKSYAQSQRRRDCWFARPLIRMEQPVLAGQTAIIVG